MRMKHLTLALAAGVFSLSAAVAWCCTNEESKHKTTFHYGEPGIQCPFGPCWTKTVLHMYPCRGDNGTDCVETTATVREVHTPVACLEEMCAYQVQWFPGPATYTVVCPP